MTDQSGSEQDTNSEQEESTILSSRRGVLMTITAAGIGSATASGGAAAQSQRAQQASRGKVNLDTANDAYGMNTSGRPDKVSLAPDSRFVVELPDDIPSRTTIIVSIIIRPKGGSFETIAQVPFVVSGRTNEYVIKGDDFRNISLTRHSNVDVDMWEISDDMDVLDDMGNRYQEQEFDLKVQARIRGRKQPMLESSPQSFKIVYSREAGLGMMAGYALGTRIPFPTGQSGPPKDVREKLEKKMKRKGKKMYNPGRGNNGSNPGNGNNGS